MEILYYNNKLSKIKHKLQKNNDTIKKKISISIIIGLVLTLLLKTNIIAGIISYGLYIYGIISIYTYTYILTNKKILTGAIGTLLFLLINKIGLIIIYIPIIDIVSIIAVPILKKIIRKRIKTFNYENKNNEEKEENKSYKQKYKYFTKCDTIEEIKKEYHELVKKYHPDNETGNINTFQEIQEEYKKIIREKEYEE